MPVLGDVPVVGRLFSNKAMSSVNTELVVLITPYIIDDGQGPLDGELGARLEAIGTDLEDAPRRIEEVMGRERYFEDVIRGNTDPISRETSSPP